MRLIFTSEALKGRFFSIFLYFATKNVIKERAHQHIKVHSPFEGICENILSLLLLKVRRQKWVRPDRCDRFIVYFFHALFPFLLLITETTRIYILLNSSCFCNAEGKKRWGMVTSFDRRKLFVKMKKRPAQLLDSLALRDSSVFIHLSISCS